MAAGRTPWRLYCFLIAGVALLDQATKVWVMRAVHAAEQVPVIPGCVSLVHIYNEGAAWGLFSGQQFALAILSGVVFILLLVYQRRFTGGWPWRQWALGTVLGGVLGNMYDRLFRDGGVVDFLLVYYRQWQWPAFNVADSAICIGVGIYVYHSLRWPDPMPLGADPAAPDPAAPAGSSPTDR